MEKERKTKEEEEEKRRWKQWPALLSSATTGGARKLPGPIHIRYFSSELAELCHTRGWSGLSTQG